MGDNGANAYEVTFGRIMFLQKIIEGHSNVASFDRHSDIVFDVARIAQRDNVQVVCVDEYALSESMARQILSEFPQSTIIFVGGKWNGPTREATAYCKSRKVGVFNAGSINAALLKTKYWQ